MYTPSMLLLVLVCAVFQGSTGQESRQGACEQGSCYPATGDLLIGREAQLTASSTCGLERPQRYCVVSYLEKDTKCFTCDSRQPWMAGVSELSHRIENIVSSFKGRTFRWWQAESGLENVYIQLDLEAEFHFTHLIMTFKTFRPKAMLIERSFDFGKSWKVYRYFAQNCVKSFPRIRKRVPSRLSDVICEEKYSAETPSTSGEVIFRVLPPFIPIPDPYTEEVQDLLKLTNLRINFTDLHTLGDTLLDNRPEIKEKYYYSLYDVTVRGSCSCYGHASRCLPVAGYRGSQETLQNMVHGMCECTHNTKGLNCEMCQDFYHDRPWGPARPNKPNVCKQCNCNNHATTCHFDAARFLASGNVSGGVCDNCVHNTRGINCQECMPFYFQDPNRDIRDPEICQPCDCDTLGSLNRGECRQATDEVAGTVAGSCICKRYVIGPRCDRCRQNFWNLQSENPFGCKPCSCSSFGTLPDAGCNTMTGRCTCKRYVTGTNCDCCYPGFYDLRAENRYGCTPCDCDIGGAVTSSCDQRTGQCHCRPHIRGKQCRQVDPGFFFAHLDYYVYEAEYGRGLGNARVYIREPLTGSSTYWTGPGYMKVMEGDSLEFSVSGLPLSMYYDIVIRYESKMPDVFRDIRVSVIRPGHVDPNGPCGDFSPRSDLKSVSLHPGVRHQIVSPPSCLEQRTTYTIRLDAHMYNTGQRHPEATLYIDSISLVPNANYVPIYQGPGLPEYLKNEFLNLHCDTLQYPTQKSVLPEQCLKHTFSISAVLHNGAIDCDCDRTGSLSLECNPSGGQCDCRPNIVGRRCDQCAPGTFGFGPRGCSRCNCHEIGARDNFCSEQTGQCTCIENVAGRACDLCRVGFWGFPQCRPCQCNANTDRCDPLTGACINCRDFTAGSFCERCEQGYYGDPRIGVQIPCKPCLCPGGPSSSVQHADSCTFNPVTQVVTCNCRPGYTGQNCDSCIDNYYGAPTLLGDQCQPCSCNNNINPDDPGSCDGTTGECLKCLFNTQGFACEHCRAGFYGDATKQNCIRCVCHQLGTDTALGECDRQTGQCPCLPNVVGQQCDRCASGHWNIASRQGCTQCNCDLSGSTTSQCNQITGQCVCLSGRGGPQCSDCSNFFYGDPYHQCLPCDCNQQGSRSFQCDRRTGQCVCVEGVTGYKCDRCARGTTGVLPNCVPCGECFDNWEKIIMHLQDETNDLVKHANELAISGPTRVFDEDFSLMQRDMAEISRILSGLSYNHVDISDINRMIEDVKNRLEDNTRALNKVDEDLRAAAGRVKRDNFRIPLLKTQIHNLKALAKELQDNVTNVHLQEVGGAYDTIKEAEHQSRAAQNQADGTFHIVAESERIRRETERLVNAGQERFIDQLEDNIWNLNRLESDVMALGDDLTDINKLVCGQPGLPCSPLCGGGGCGRCGGDGCTGAVTVSQNALHFAQQAEDLLNDRRKNATDVLIPELQEARDDAISARLEAQMAYNEVAKVKNESETTRINVEALLNRIRHFLTDRSTVFPDSVEQVALQVLALEIPLKSEQIVILAEKIARVVSTLTDIEKVLAETAENRSAAVKLKEQAEAAFIDAKTIYTTAQGVKIDLEETKIVQAVAEKAIDKARSDIRSAEQEIDMIDKDIADIQGKAFATKTILDILKDKVAALTKRYTDLRRDTLDPADRLADKASTFAKDALANVTELSSSYDEVTQEVNAKLNMTKAAVSLAEKLKAQANRIYNFTQTKMRELKDLQESFGRNEKRLIDHEEKIKTLNKLMDGYLHDIKRKVKDYDTC